MPCITSPSENSRVHGRVCEQESRGRQSAFDASHTHGIFHIALIVGSVA